MRLYSASDMVKAGCMDCAGCSHCCRGMGDSIVLDPLDAFHLMECLHMSFEELLKDSIALHVEEGLILPHVQMRGREEACYFLSETGRCTIHNKRPGLCRAFPLGRQYTDGTLSYFLLEGACAKKQHTKVKVSKWTEMEDMPHYGKYLESWHAFIKEMKGKIRDLEENDVAVKRLNMSLLQIFYFLPYEKDRDFLAQYGERLDRFSQCHFEVD